MTLRAVIAAFFAAAISAAPTAAGPAFFVGAGEDDPATLARAVPVAGDLGIRAFRVPVRWALGQTALDAEQAAGLDRLVAAAPRSLRLVLVTWAGGDQTPLDDAARTDYCSFTRGVVARYPRMNDVIIWNEPNKEMFWRPQYDADGTSAAPAAYVALLARCYDMLRAFRPSVNVVAPATSPRGNDRPNAVSNISHSPLAFIDRMGAAYRASGRTRRIFDTVAHHVYGSSSRERPWRTHPTTQISQGDWDRLIAVLSLAFDGTPQPRPGECQAGRCVWIWWTEAGYQTMPDEAKASLYSNEEDVATLPDFIGGEPLSPPPSVTQPAPDHHTQVVDGIRLAACQPYVQAFFNYLVVDSQWLNRWQSGFLWADWTPKDSYPAAKAVIAEANGDRVDCGTLKSGPAPAIDATAPSRPLRPALKRARRSISVNWPDARDGDVMGYAVLRSSKSRGPFRRLKAALTASSAYVDRGLRPGRRYCYAVVAFDTSENQSRRSRVRCAATKRR